METSKDMPNSARTWIYAANRPLLLAEQQHIQLALDKFTAEWTAHEQVMKAKATVLYNQFVLIMLDESFNDISGCGIDKSVKLMKDLGSILSIDFFNRLLIQVLVNENVQTYSKNSLQLAIHEGLINQDTLTFNHLVQNKLDLIQNWLQPLNQSWISKQLQFLVEA